MDLADFEEGQQNNLPDIDDQHQNQLNVGFVEFIEPAGDPLFQQYLNHSYLPFMPNVDAVRIWAIFFSPLEVTSLLLISLIIGQNSSQHFCLTPPASYGPKISLPLMLGRS